MNDDTCFDSAELSAEIDRLSIRYPEVSFAKLTRIAVHIAKWTKERCDKVNSSPTIFLQGSVNKSWHMHPELIPTDKRIEVMSITEAEKAIDEPKDYVISARADWFNAFVEGYRKGARQEKEDIRKELIKIMNIL